MCLASRSESKPHSPPVTSVLHTRRPTLGGATYPPVSCCAGTRVNTCFISWGEKLSKHTSQQQAAKTLITRLAKCISFNDMLFFLCCLSTWMNEQVPRMRGAARHLPVTCRNASRGSPAKVPTPASTARANSSQRPASSV